MSGNARERVKGAPVVRPASVADAHRIGAIDVRSWRATYEGHLPESLLASLDPKAVERDMIATLTHRRPRREVLVAEGGKGLSHKVVGFAALGPAGERAAIGLAGPPDDLGQLFMIYVDPTWLGHGYGHALHEAMIEVAGTFNFRRLVLWVLPENARARAFYEAHGWTCDGREQTEEFHGHPVPEIRYVRDV